MSGSDARGPLSALRSALAPALRSALRACLLSAMNALRTQGQFWVYDPSPGPSPAPSPATRPLRGPAPGHPERLCPEAVPTAGELLLYRQVFGDGSGGTGPGGP
ncbi:DUF6059 family protein [Streptomyces hiroshimensis]|uniref:Uncharacterized protein n=1 Tax=Streptomyces hiroshimensis TaxID=66424 RepID=A0ABQ2YVI4_9ACTN|nr:DUF6059 family protein [Streptomyces hiroshimensis]GGX96656.1 hypothetical protein GCM10010324_48310 [Streptomyces hiroshimensis]